MYFRRTGELLAIKLCGRNLIKGINTWAVPRVRSSESFLIWTKEELRQVDQRTRKLNMNKTLQRRDDIYRLYVSRKEGRKGLASIEDCIDAAIQRLKDNIKKCKERLITAANNSIGNIWENTHLCSSLHKLLTPRRELMCGRIEREAGSQGKEQKHNNNFVVKTPREDGERVTLCG